MRMKLFLIIQGLFFFFSTEMMADVRLEAASREWRQQATSFCDTIVMSGGSTPSALWKKSLFTHSVCSCTLIWWGQVKISPQWDFKWSHKHTASSRQLFQEEKFPITRWVKVCRYCPHSREGCSERGRLQSRKPRGTAQLHCFSLGDGNTVAITTQLAKPSTAQQEPPLLQGSTGGDNALKL